MYCNNCGEEIKDGEVFCPYCGTKILSEDVHDNNSANSYKKNKKSKNLIGKKKIRIAIAAIVIGLIILNVVQLLDRRYKSYIYNSQDSLTKSEMESEIENEIEKADITINTLKSDEINVGDCITFGRYEQDNDLNNGAEDIEWRVIDIETSSNDGGNRILVISKCALDCLPYNEEHEDITWEKCDLRKWLNNEFYNGAFSKEEKNQILLINNDNPDASSYREDIMEGKGGNDTADNVFLLSFKQAENLFSSVDDRECSPTDYAMRNGAYFNSEHRCPWWLRSPGLHQDDAVFVSVGGVLGNYCDVDYDDIGVRPALWIYVD